MSCSPLLFPTPPFYRNSPNIPRIPVSAPAAAGGYPPSAPEAVFPSDSRPDHRL
ncbi:hypothetical protein ACLOJK_027567 [Asimina triloba]